MVDLITQELVWLKKRGLCDRILLDRGFNDEKIYNQIYREDIEFLMPFKRNKALDKVFDNYRPRVTKRELKKGAFLKLYRPKGWIEPFRVVAIRVKVADPKQETPEK